MIDFEEENVFPNNIVTILKTRYELLDASFQGSVFRRPLRTTDPALCVGVFATTWDQEDESVEMGGGHPHGSREGVFQDYNVVTQTFVKDMDEERGLAKSSVLCKHIRATLARDEPLAVALRTLNSSVGGQVEVLASWRLGTQRMYTNELKGSWLYMSTLDLKIQTQTN